MSLAPRHSLYPSTSHLAPSFGSTFAGTSLASLQSCISSVSQSCATLEASTSTLATSVSDFPRLAKVLKSKRHFDLISESDIAKARHHLQAEIAPQLRELILKAEEALEGDEKRAKAVKAKLSQLQARHSQLSSLHSAQAGRDAASSRSTGLLASQLANKESQVQELARRREELLKKVERLERDVEREEAENGIIAA